MKRLLLIAVSAFSLFAPSFAAAQGWTVVYRHELRAFVVVPAPDPAPQAVRRTLTPSEVIARHEPMAAGLRANPRDSVGLAAVHCDRLIAEAREALRRAH